MTPHYLNRSLMYRSVDSRYSLKSGFIFRSIIAIIVSIKILLE